MKIVLAYSGGLDTSVIIKWLMDKYAAEIIAVTADLGEGKDLDFVRDKALKIGATSCHVIDAQEDFVRHYVYPALKANLMYEGKYPLATALARPLIAKMLVDIAKNEGAEAIAHGCTGKGNDQVRFDVSTIALAPELKVIAPVRDWPMSREEEIAYAAANDIPVPVKSGNPFSIDQNLWGRSIECGILEDPWAEAPEEAFELTCSIGDAPDTPTYVEIEFAKGEPIALDGRSLAPAQLVHTLNQLAGANGVGRIDHLENRLVGIKSREIYEAPAAVVLTAAHRDLEQLVLTRDTLDFKRLVEGEYAKLVYNGLWFSPLRAALDAFVDATQTTVTGTVRVKLHKGNYMPVGRKSPFSLYDEGMSTYDKGDLFDHSAAAGFISLWGLPLRINAQVNGAPE